MEKIYLLKLYYKGKPFGRAYKSKKRSNLSNDDKKKGYSEKEWIPVKKKPKKKVTGFPRFPRW